MSASPWNDSAEWEDVFEMLYGSEMDRKRNGLARIAAWKARGNVPALLEVTTDLVSCVVHEEDTRNLEFCEDVLRLMYSAALTRFVNGVFDVYYVTSMPGFRDIKTVLGHFGVPAYIVALRHECVHGTLPSLESLKCATDFGLQWLLRNYWEPQRLVNQQAGENCGVDGKLVQFDNDKVRRVNVKRRKSTNETKALLSASSVSELSHKLWSGEILYIPESKVSVPGVCDAQLPRVEVDTVRWNQWKTAVSRAAETRPGLETMIVSAFISAMHHPCCAEDRKHFLAGCLELMLVSPASGAWFNVEAVNWMLVFPTVLNSPGIYSEALMNIVLPRVSNSLAAGIGRRGGQLASLMSWSERLSQRAYSRPSTTSTGVHEGLSSEINTTSEGQNRVPAEEAPVKRLRLDINSSSSKWRLSTGWTGSESGQESMKELDMKFLHSPPEPVHHPVTCLDSSGSRPVQRPFSMRDIATIKLNIHKHFIIG